MKSLIIIITIIIFSSFIYSQEIKTEYKSVLKIWLDKNPNLILPNETDASQEDLKAWRKSNKDFQPFYAVGDFNQDGKEDFAVLLKIKGKDDTAIAIFNAPFTKSKPAYFKKGFGNIATLYIEYNNDVKMIYMTVYETEGFYLKSKKNGYVVVDVFDETQK